ncbi:MAG: hypothetical protein JWQ09_2651 [Segetibacter sp.]|nr:hypothetical protein [Segetibacter sp.]
MKQIFYLFFAASIFYSCTSPTGESDSTKIKTADASFDASKVRQSIEATNKKFTDAILKGDSATVVSLYHTDAEVYPPNMPADKKTLMGSMAASVLKSGIKTFSLHTGNVTGNEDQVVETGTFEMGDGSKTVDKGKYIVVWKPENGDWKLWRDIWNSDNPPAPASK